MGKRKVKSGSRKRTGKGIVSTIIDKAKSTVGTIVNRAVDLLPVEAHIPGYRFCGPGTNLKKRLARGDRGINPLDEACRTHDIAYSQYSDTGHRAQADRELAERAWQRVKASDSSLAEKAAAWAVTNVMKVKAKLGGGKRRKKSCGCKKGKGLYLKPYPKQGGGVKKKKRTGGKKKLRSRRGR